MAKQIKAGSCMLRIISGGGATPRLHVESYNIGDSVDSTITYSHSGTAPADGPQRDLTAGELSGTLQAFLDAREAAYKTAEGIV